MSSTNKTEHYNLPQFIGSDIPTWLGDINSAMTAIDSGINAAATSASGAATTAAQALTDAEAAATSASGAAKTAAQALTDAVAAKKAADDAAKTAAQALTDAGAAQNALNAKANTSTLATVESTSTASQAYSVGDYLVLKGQLYEVTTAITSGETFTVGTNISATTVGDELTSLNNGLISADYTEPIAITTDEESHSGTFTAPRSGFAFMNWQCTNGDGWVDMSVNGVLAASGNNVGGAISCIPLKKGDVMTWRSSSTGYIRGKEARGQRSIFC